LFGLGLLLVAAWLLLPRLWPARHQRPWSVRFQTGLQWRGLPAALAISMLLLAGVLLAPADRRGVAWALLGGWMLGVSALRWLRPSHAQPTPQAEDVAADLLQAVPVALAEVDRNRRLRRVNQALLDLLELPAEALPAGTSVARLVELLAERCLSSAQSPAVAEVDGGSAGLAQIDVLDPLLQMGKVDGEGLVRLPMAHGRCRTVVACWCCSTSANASAWSSVCARPIWLPVGKWTDGPVSCVLPGKKPSRPTSAARAF
jgi:PAS domain-containing protein